MSRMKQKLLVITFVNVALLIVPEVHAGTVVCAGRVVQISYHASDRFMLQLDSMNKPVFFCSSSSTWSVAGTSHTTSPETCKALVAMFLAAKLADRTLEKVYFDGDAVPVSCDAWESFTSANLRYFAWAD